MEGKKYIVCTINQSVLPYCSLSMFSSKIHYDLEEVKKEIYQKLFEDEEEDSEEFDYNEDEGRWELYYGDLIYCIYEFE